MLINDRHAVDASIKRVQAWLLELEEPLTVLARKAELHEKTLRIARLDGWNPRADTLRKIERLIPSSWRPADRTAQEASE